MIAVCTCGHWEHSEECPECPCERFVLACGSRSPGGARCTLPPHNAGRHHNAEQGQNWDEGSAARATGGGSQ